MSFLRYIFVSIVAVGVVVTLGRTSQGHGAAREGHESHGEAHHEPKHEEHHEGHHEEHHEDHHEGHHEEHHDGHHEEHPGDHHEEHHEGHHEDHPGDHHEEHHDAHHEDHHEEHHDAHHDEHHEDHHDAHHESYDDRHANDYHHEIDRHEWCHHEWWHHQLSWHNHSWNYWWHCSTANEISTWLTGLGLATPIYYDYGPNGNVVYRNNNVYVNGTLAGTTDEYTNSVTALANANQATGTTDSTNNQADNWLPLGTFAMLPENGDTKPSQTLQLAIDKAGNVSGVLFDLTKDTSTPIHGSLDQKTQRVAFDLGTKSGLVAETGIYNLSKDDVTLLVHHGNDKPQTCTLVRFQTPPADAKEKDAEPSST